MNALEGKKEKDRSVQKNQTARPLSGNEEDFSDADETLSDEEYYQKYLADGRLDSDAWMQEQEAFTEAVQKELRQETSREVCRLESDPSLAGQEPSPELLDRILVGMEVIREREEDSNAMGEVSSDTKAETSPEGAEVISCADGSNGKDGLGVSATESTGIAAEKAGYNPEAYLSEEDLRALEFGRRHLHKPKRRRIRHVLAAAAAVFACVLVVGVSSEANRVRIANAFNVLIGKEALIKINNDEENRNESTLKDMESKARAEIEKKTGIKTVQFMYNPEYLIYDGYEISASGTKWASLFYQYHDTIFTVYMEKKEDGTARGEIVDGDILETFSVDTKIGEVQILELKADSERKYVAKFVYDNAYYKMYGALPREEFVKIIEFLFF